MMTVVDANDGRNAIFACIKMKVSHTEIHSAEISTMNQQLAAVFLNRYKESLPHVNDLMLRLALAIGLGPETLVSELYLYKQGIPFADSVRYAVWFFNVPEKLERPLADTSVYLCYQRGRYIFHMRALAKDDSSEKPSFQFEANSSGVYPRNLLDLFAQLANILE